MLTASLRTSSIRRVWLWTHSILRDRQPVPKSFEVHSAFRSKVSERSRPLPQNRNALLAQDEKKNHVSIVSAQKGIVDLVSRISVVGFFHGLAIVLQRPFNIYIVFLGRQPRKFVCNNLRIQRLRCVSACYCGLLVLAFAGPFK